MSSAAISSFAVGKRVNIRSLSPSMRSVDIFSFVLIASYAASLSSLFSTTPAKWSINLKSGSPSSRLLNNKSSQIFLSSSLILCIGSVFLTLTIAMLSPASTQWCKKTEFKYSRACFAKPNEMFEIPRTKPTSGCIA